MDVYKCGKKSEGKEGIILVIIAYNVLSYTVIVYPENICTTYKNTQFELLHQ